MIFNVLDFGARGDGITDDTSAIQAAIDAAHASGGGTVYVPAGTFIVSGTSDKSDGAIRLLDNVTLQGAGMGTTTLKVQDNNPYSITGVVRTPFNEVTHDVALLDLTIDGNRANNTGKIDGFYTGVRPGDPRQDYNITVEGVEIMNCSGYGFDPHEQTLNLRIADCVAHHNGLDGFVADYLIDSVYENNVAYANDRHGFNVTTSTDGLLLLNNTAYDNGSAGLIVQRGSEDIAFPQNITVEGGSYYDNAREGIYLKMADDVTISGVEVYGNMRQGVRIEGATNTLLQNSTIYNNSQEGDNTYDEVQIRAHFDKTTGQTYYSVGSQILDNTIFSNGAVNARYGVREEATNDDGGPTGTVVSGNSISGTDSGFVSVPSGSDDPVSAVDDAYAVTAGTSFTASAAQSLLINDIIPDGGGSAVAGQSTTARGGTVRVNADGTFTYTAKAGFLGQDSFTYTARDADGDTDIGTVVLNVRASASIAVGATELETLTLDGFSAVSIKAATGGTAIESRAANVEARAKGTFTGEAGTYQLTLSYFDENDGNSLLGIRVNGSAVASWVADKQLGSSSANATTLTTYSVNVALKTYDIIEIYGTRKDGELMRIDQLVVQPTDGPVPTDNPVVAADDRYAATEDTVLTVSAVNGVLANDTAADGGKTAMAGAVTTASGGLVNLAADGSFTYTPRADFFGSDSFEYTVLDVDGDRDTGTVALTVADVAEQPTPAHPAITAGKTQLETLELDGFNALSLKTADGGQAVENRIKGVEATATGTFTGATGTYQATLWYYDENDGSPALGIRVNGQTAVSWFADKQLGSGVADAATRTSFTTNLQLSQGDTVEIFGTRDNNDLVRIDYLSLDGLAL